MTRFMHKIEMGESDYEKKLHGKFAGHHLRQPETKAEEKKEKLNPMQKSMKKLLAKKLPKYRSLLPEVREREEREEKEKKVKK